VAAPEARAAFLVAPEDSEALTAPEERVGRAVGSADLGSPADLAEEADSPAVPVAEALADKVAEAADSLAVRVDSGVREASPAELADLEVSAGLVAVAIQRVRSLRLRTCGSS
jgi:hypothetical protein